MTSGDGGGDATTAFKITGAATPASISCVATGTTVSAEAVRQPTHNRKNNGVLRTASALVVEVGSTTNHKIGRACLRTAHSFSGEEVFRRFSDDDDGV
jgi:hypothetical protein